MEGDLHGLVEVVLDYPVEVLDQGVVVRCLWEDILLGEVLQDRDSLEAADASEVLPVEARIQARRQSRQVRSLGQAEVLVAEAGAVQDTPWEESVGINRSI